MKRHLLLPLIMIILVSCDESKWFSRPIDYKGNTQERQMVVTSDLKAGFRPQVYVNTAYFANDPDLKDTTVRENLMGDDRWVVWSSRDGYIRRGYLHEAIVQMRINGGEWTQLHEVCDTVFRRYDKYWYPQIRHEQFYYTCSYVLQAGDSVEVRVHESSFPSDVCGAQRIPDKIDAWVDNYSLMKYQTEYTDIYLLLMDLHMHACIDRGDLLRIKSTTFSYYFDYDTLTIVDMITAAQDMRFSKYDAVCEHFSEGWYGNRVLGIFADTPTEDAVIPIAVSFAEKPFTEGYKIGIDSILLDVDLVTMDEYRYTASLAKADEVDWRIIDYWSNSAYNKVNDIVQTIEGTFQVLGNLEVSPIYVNVEGGFGHVTASSGTRIVLDSMALSGLTY